MGTKTIEVKCRVGWEGFCDVCDGPLRAIRKDARTCGKKCSNALTKRRMKGRDTL